MYDPERSRERLVPNDYKRMYDPQRGHDVLVSGPYITIRDELGDEIGRIKTSDLWRLLEQKER
jgi:hypothetical protein